MKETLIFGVVSPPGTLSFTGSYKNTSSSRSLPVPQVGQTTLTSMELNLPPWE